MSEMSGAISFDREQDIEFTDYFESQLGTNWCWAACATSIYNYTAAVNGDYDIETVQADMVSLQKGEATYTVGDAGSLLESLNFQAKVYDEASESFSDFAVKVIDSGVPLLLSWAQDGVNSHYVIVYAYISGNDTFIIMDPQQFAMFSIEGYRVAERVTYAAAISPPNPTTFLMNPLCNELIPDNGVQNFWVQNNSCDEQMTLDDEIISNGKTYSIGTDFAYYIRMTKDIAYDSSSYLATAVKIHRADGHSYKQWLHYGNLLTEAKKHLEIGDINYQEVYGYQLNDFWVHFVPVLI